MSDRSETKVTVLTGVWVRVRRALEASVVMACALLVTGACESVATSRAGSVVPTSQQGPTADHPYVGMWVTADGRIRQELLTSGRYDEARGERERGLTRVH